MLPLGARPLSSVSVNAFHLARALRAVARAGSGALAGNPFRIDRQFLAKELGFHSVMYAPARLRAARPARTAAARRPNSIDAVCNRDCVAEFLFWASLTMIHISQWCAGARARSLARALGRACRTRARVRTGPRT